MPVTIHCERDDIYRLDIRRLLRQADLMRAEDALFTEITRIGSVKLLVVLTEFEGWNGRATGTMRRSTSNTGTTSRASPLSDQSDGAPRC